MVKNLLPYSRNNIKTIGSNMLFQPREAWLEFTNEKCASIANCISTIVNMEIQNMGEFPGGICVKFF